MPSITFESFTGPAAETMLKIRHEVFTLEQQVPAEEDIDGLDDSAWQVLAWHEGEAVGTGRMTPQGKIGRIAVREPFRKLGIGKLIVEALVNKARAEGLPMVRLGAQVSAIGFYEKLGFHTYGELYMDGGIEHRPMEQVLS